VTHVFITHAHFDHMGGTDDFPNATFYVQERELSKWVWAMSLAGASVGSWGRPIPAI
jgi:Metal-dependent hydrolases of the beta-lactamase superfamily I